jgi:hypothetical protein
LGASDCKRRVGVREERQGKSFLFAGLRDSDTYLAILDEGAVEQTKS